MEGNGLKKEGKDWIMEAKKWCSCNLGEEAYSYHIPPDKDCAICRVTIDNDHYHCGACLKLSQIG